MPEGESENRRVGPYRLLDRIGAGGMGEVWRARDDRLGRDVALKLLDPSRSPGAIGVARFEQEARAVAALSHPNVLAVFDVGEGEGVRFIATELLEGAPLSDKLRAGALPQVQAIDLALQVARGVAAAHQRGIVHRDLKPANVFVTRSGHVKVLDFGLAQLTAGPATSGEETAEVAPGPHTAAGTILGTVGYMAPEQIRGEPVDHRADIFSLGVLLYEMLAGRRPFIGPSTVETLHAVLKEAPPDLSSLGTRIAPAIDRLVRRCLEKDPADRFQSSGDLVFALEALALGTEGAVPPPIHPVPRAPIPSRPGGKRWFAAAGAAAGVAALLAVGAAGARWLASAPSVPSPIEVQRVTFRRGAIDGARFTPDGHSIVLSARWGGQAATVEVLREGARESVAVPGASGDLAAVTGTDIYLLTNTRLADTREIGTLVRVPFAGGPARTLAEDAYAADFPAGEDRGTLVLDRGIEHPPGQLAVSIGRPVAVRLSPGASRLAWLDRARADAVLITDVATGAEVAVDLQQYVTGFAWHPRTGALWVSADDEAGSTSLWALDATTGTRRLVRRSEGRIALHDMAADGRALLELSTIRRETFAALPGAAAPVDLGWLTWTAVADLSDDAHGVLLNDWPAVYLRPIDGQSAPIRIADGWAYDLSPDGAWALVTKRPGGPGLDAVPTGAGNVRVVLDDTFTVIGAAWFHAKGTRVSALARKGEERERIWDVALVGGTPAPLTEPGTDVFYGQRPWSPDEQTIATESLLVPVGPAASSPRRILGLRAEDAIMGWTSDGAGLRLLRRDRLPATFSVLDPGTGERIPDGEAVIADPAGVRRVNVAMSSLDGTTRVWTYERESSELYLVSGLQ